MAKISGASGTATFGGTLVAITGWTCEVAGEVIDVTDSSNTTWKEFLASGFTSWNGTFEGFAIAGVADLTTGGTAAALSLVANATNSYSGNAIVTNVSTNLDVPGAEATKKSYTFQGTGTLTQAIS